MTTIKIFGTLFFLLFALHSRAQSTSSEAPGATSATTSGNTSNTEQGDIDFVEGLLEKNAVQFKNAPTRSLNPNQKQQTVEYGAVQSQEFYADLATIQRNYMPKSERVFVSGGVTLLPTDVFFRTTGLNVKTSYHFSETWGLEAFGYLFTSSARPEVNELGDKQNLSVKSLVSVNAFYGANIYFNSMYGKTSLLNSRILPFEIYQTIGLGRVRTQDSQESTAFQIGLGDVFSLSRSSAVRVDLTWAFYNAKNYLGDQQSANSLFLTLSYGHFFPEPNYR